MSARKWISRFKLPAEQSSTYPVAVASFQDPRTHRTLVLVAGTEGIVSISAADQNLTGSEDPFACTVVYGGLVKTLKITESLVLAITQEGQLLVLDMSCNQFVPIDGYCCEGKIRHVEQGVPSNQLLVVRQTETGPRTVLDVMESDNTEPHSFRLLQSYDLALDLVDPETRVIVKAVPVEPENQQFLSNFLGFSELVHGQCVLLASANNKFYWLQQQEENIVDLNVLHCFASNVVDFEFSATNPCSLVVLLDAGVLMVFRDSFQSETEFCTSFCICLQSPPVESYAFDTVHNSLLYSNGFGMFRLWYNHEADIKDNAKQCEEIAVYGVVAIALIVHQSRALLLTENNQLYLYDVTPWQRNATFDPARLVKLGRNMHRTTRRLTRRLTEEVELDGRLEEAIGVEESKFNVLALYRNRRMFGQLATMETSFHSVMPARPSGTLMLSEGSKDDPVALFACVKLSLNQECFELLAKQRRWSICLSYQQRTIVCPVHESFSKEGVLNAIIMLGKSQLNRGLPVFRAQISSAVLHGGDSALLTLTQQIPIGKCYITVDETAPFTIREHAPQNLRTVAVEEIIRSNREGRTEKPPVLAKTRLAYGILNESSKQMALSITGELVMHIPCTWYALDEPVNIDWPTKNGPIRLSSCHPVALDFVKRFLLKADETSTEMALQREKLKAFFLELQAAQEDDLIRQLYRRVRIGGDEFDGESLTNFHHLNFETSDREAAT
ncbi:uncharacterized protein LOC126573232 [Anopheles aquasalis]|uniref:uncharacterized protein LOC126573232 n=1 Tax=Anopheles aquasalis TaxID=42839 RepID=UPI00215A2F35|nr:uncharacterized protein LOC126573232 [Anopheles aquasalis]